MSSTEIPGIAELSGPVILAYLFHWGLFGSLTKLYVYYQAFPNDPWVVKSLVYLVYTVQTLGTILGGHDAFAIFGAGFGSLPALTATHFTWLTVPVIGGIAGFLAQFFYAYRVYILSRSVVASGLILATSLTATVGAFVLGAFISQAGDLSLLNNFRTTVALGIWCGASAFTDIFIAVCMTYNLTKHDTGFRQTHMLINKIMRLTIETGSLTAVMAIINLSLFVGFPNRFYYITPAAVLESLYGNTILVVLNARIKVVGGRGAPNHSTDIFSAPIFAGDTRTETDGTATSTLQFNRNPKNDLDRSVEMKTMNEV
ncbi:hypothetical protein C8R43DRAFT_21343 [Mycena crocata]|nr:hypothetical protein C8R43DRAFT_21343 [Mycena crocata]